MKERMSRFISTTCYLKKNDVKQEIDGIFQVSVNEEGLCTFFKQWRFTR